MSFNEMNCNWNESQLDNVLFSVLHGRSKDSTKIVLFWTAYNDANMKHCVNVLFLLCIIIPFYLMIFFLSSHTVVVTP